MSKIISVNDAVLERLEAVKEKLKGMEYNDGRTVNWSDAIRYELKKSGAWDMSKSTKKKKGKKNKAKKKSEKIVETEEVESEEEEEEEGEFQDEDDS